MKKTIKVISLVISLFFISVISFNCQEDEVRIWGIEIDVYGRELYKEIDLYTKNTGLNFVIKTKYDYFGSLYKPSSSCYAMYDPNIVVVNPIDTSTIEFYCGSKIIIDQDTIQAKTNLFTEKIFRDHMHIHNDMYGGFLFSLTTEDDFFEENMNFVYESDSLFTFTFKGETEDYITLEDSIKIKINWN